MPLLFWILAGLNAGAAPVITMQTREHRCEFSLSPVGAGTRETFNGFLRISDKQEMFVRLEQPRWRKPKGWYVLVHGLLETHRSFDAVTAGLLTRGYGVVRMDLRGFGRTLHREIQNAETRGGRYFAPSLVPFDAHVADLTGLLEVLRSRFRIERPRLAGHSLGGGIVLALLATPEGSALASKRATVIAPYIYRLDYYMAEKLAFMGFPTPDVFMAAQRLLPGVARAAPEFWLDSLIADPQMQAALGDYFDNVILTRELAVPADQLGRVRRRHVNNAIAAVKGAREFNALEAVVHLPRTLRVDLIYGDSDPLIERRLARKLGSMLTDRGGRMTEVQAGHMLMDEATPELVKGLLVP